MKHGRSFGGSGNSRCGRLADVVRTTAQRARGSPLDQYLPWYIVRFSRALSEKFTESLNSCAGIARVESENGLATTSTKSVVVESLCFLWLPNAGRGTHDVWEFG